MSSRQVETRRERNRQETHRAIRGAALRLASERGVERVTVEDISEAADIAPRTFFNYFRSKEDALLAGGAAGLEELQTVLADRPPGEAPLITLRYALHFRAESARENADEVLGQLHLVQANPSLLPGQLARYVEVERLIAAALSRQLGPTEDAVMTAELMSLLGSAVMRVAMQRWLKRPEADLCALIDQALHALNAQFLRGDAR